VGLCNRFEEGICAKKKESLSLVLKRVRRGKRVHSEADKEGIHSTIKVTTDSTSICYRKE